MQPPSHEKIQHVFVVIFRLYKYSHILTSLLSVCGNVVTLVWIQF